MNTQCNRNRSVYLCPAIGVNVDPTSTPLSAGTSTVTPPLCRTRNPAKQFTSAVGPSYIPANIPSDAAPSTTLPSSTRIVPPISIASSAVNVVCPSNPLPPVIVSPADVTLKCAPGSATAHAFGSKAGWLNASSISVRSVARNANSLSANTLVVPSPTKTSLTNAAGSSSPESVTSFANSRTAPSCKTCTSSVPSASLSP